MGLGTGINPDAPGTPQGSVGGVAGGNWIAALASAGAQLYDNYQNRKTARENTDKTIAAQKWESQYSWEKQLEMMNYQNWYNSPEQQMARFAKAGLNKHLIYGQGTPGNMTSTPQYQRANVQYAYAPRSIAPAISTILPTLMSVGSWMQDMRYKEAQIRSTSLGADKTQQLIDYLSQANPGLLEMLSRKITSEKYAGSIKHTMSQQARLAMADLQQEFNYKWGKTEDGSTKYFMPEYSDTSSPVGGTKYLDFVAKQAETKLKEAQASWSEFDITNPQAIMQLVLSGILGMAGSTLKLSTQQSRGKSTAEKVQRTTQGGFKERYNSPAFWRGDNKIVHDLYRQD